MKIKELYHRFRTWQKTPTYYWDKGVAEHRCPNCGLEFTGNYCPNCGQQAGDGHITWRWVWKSILDVWGMDSRSLPYTLVQLLLRPGYLIGDYISGRRQVCYKPVNMLFIIAIFYVILSQFFGHSNSVTVISGVNASSVLSRVTMWLSSHPAWAAMSLTMIMIFPTHLLFRFAPRNSLHTLPESIFIQLFMCTLMLICALVSKLLNHMFWILPFYYYITYRQLFGYRPWGTLWRLMVSAFVWAILLLAVLTPVILITVDDATLEFADPSTRISTAITVFVILLLLSVVLLAIGYWIGKKTARLQKIDTQ